jgi:hypothetical protein
MPWVVASLLNGILVLQWNERNILARSSIVRHSYPRMELPGSEGENSDVQAECWYAQIPIGFRKTPRLVNCLIFAHVAIGYSMVWLMYELNVGTPCAATAKLGKIRSHCYTAGLRKLNQARQTRGRA